MPAGSPLERRLLSRLASLDADGLRRTLRAPTGVDLSSNDYLNLAADPRVVSRFADAVRHEGCGSTGSRLLRGEREAFAAVERRFAAFKGTERALYFSSGYLANLAVLTALTEPGDVVFSDERNHASLIDGLRLSRATIVIFPHNDIAGLIRLIEERWPPAPGGRPRSGAALVVVESFYSMEGDRAPVRELADLCASLGMTLIVDEAHAVGVCGPRGSGVLEDAAVDANACVSVNTAGKALGAAGAFAAGPAWAIEYLIQRARTFVFSTAAPPALAAAIDESLTIVAAEPERRERLHARARYLRRQLRAAGLDVADTASHIVPLLVGENAHAVRVAASLQAGGFDVRAIRPPTVPAGTARLRVSVNAGLSEQTLDAFVRLLAATLRISTPCCAVSS
jgi:8-amino-7-oxononanoate synthase